MVRITCVVTVYNKKIGILRRAYVQIIPVAKFLLSF